MPGIRSSSFTPLICWIRAETAKKDFEVAMAFSSVPLSIYLTKVFHRWYVQQHGDGDCFRLNLEELQFLGK